MPTRSLLRRFGAGLLRFLLYTATFLAAGTLGWGLALLPARGLKGVLDSFLFFFATGFWFLCALPLAAFFTIATRRLTARGRPILATSLGWAAVAFVATIVLTKIPGRPQHRFLEGDKWRFSADPGSMGILWDVYSFRGTVKEVSSGAISELGPPQFKARKLKDGSVEMVSRQLYENHWPLEVITISAGRTTGTYWWVDGDFLITDKDLNWVTVSVQRIDPLPLWLRLLVK